jgi:hypothetical protein
MVKRFDIQRRKSDSGADTSPSGAATCEIPATDPREFDGINDGDRSIWGSYHRKIGIFAPPVRHRSRGTPREAVTRPARSRAAWEASVKISGISDDEQSRRLVEGFVTHYNNVRLNSAGLHYPEEHADPQ